MASTKDGEQVEWVMHQGGIPNLHFLSNFDLALSDLGFHKEINSVTRKTFSWSFIKN